MTVRHSITATAAVAAMMVSGCGEAGITGSDDDPMECAAAISAYSYMGRDGQIDMDPELYSAGLVSMMTYLNSYAVPNGLSEAEAFAELDAMREELLANGDPADISERTRRCIENTPTL